jgi:hypothetical protein
MESRYPIAPELASMRLIRRPLRDSLTLLPQLSSKSSGQPDYAETGAARLIALAESAELVLQIMHEGLAAIGLLYACTVQQVEDGDIKAAHAVAIGRMQVELGEALAYMQTLAIESRRHTADYVAKPETHNDR